MPLHQTWRETPRFGCTSVSQAALARMWNGCVDHDPSGQILSAWIAKEELRALCATAARGGHPGTIRDRLHTFYCWCPDAQIPELTTLAETIETWWPAIEVFLTTGLTNARTEGTNRLIKQVKRAACGFRTETTTGAGCGCTAPGAPADCQRGTRRCPPKIEEPVSHSPPNALCAATCNTFGSTWSRLREIWPASPPVTTCTAISGSSRLVPMAGRPRAERFILPHGTTDGRPYFPLPDPCTTLRSERRRARESRRSQCKLAPGRVDPMCASDFRHPA